MEEAKQHLEEIQARLNLLVEKLQPESIKARVLQLEVLAAEPDFWHQEETARQTMQEIADLREELSSLETMQSSLKELQELLELAEAEADVLATLQEIEPSVNQLKNQLDQLEINLFLGGKYDRNNAILSIHSGQGGTEAMDWAEMLKRMYLRFFERKNWEFEIIEESFGEEAGIKSVSLLVKGKFAYGLLKRESGTHRLVRLSPFNADSLRQTSFAQVEVLPEIDEVSNELDIKEEDLEWSFIRSSGKGGQNVNKVSTAVRLKHKPSGIVVECQAERTQVQNRKLALSILSARLMEIMEAQQAKQLSELKGDYRPASWGNQIRNYVLHPYHLVKDLRTGVETSNTQAVLDGNLDEFIEAEIKLSA